MTENRVYVSTIRVLYGDTDAGGVVYNANYLRYFELGRSELMRAWVCSYKRIEELGLVLPVTESYCRYKAPAVYDDLLTIETSIGEASNIKCRFNYRITKLHQDKPKLLARGHTVHAAVTRDGRLTRLPQEIFEKICQYAATAGHSATTPE